MDIRLQGPMTAIEAGQLIRQRTGSAIIFITAYAAVFLRDPGVMQAPGICLSKPLSITQLKAALQTALNTSSRQQ
jgi:hypothetical protein